uniref:Uncharacterized protein n=1 Tax=Arundo donax TaxID=35708 RepID=A0A0A9U5I5_ARUDO
MTNSAESIIRLSHGWILHVAIRRLIARETTKG